MVDKIIKFDNGMTVAELKRVIADWPETDEDGESCKIWVGYDGVSNEVIEVCSLNSRQSADGSKQWADFMLIHNRYDRTSAS